MSDAEVESDPGDPRFWEAFYGRDDTPWDQGAPAPPLARGMAAGAFRAGARVAVPGCGRGHDALAAAALGCAVVGYDFAAPAVEAARAAARRRGLAARFEQRDIFAIVEEERGRFDGMLEHTCFCAIHPSRREEYVELAHALLVPGGTLLALFFPLGRPPGEGPPYGVDRAGLERDFGARFRVVEVEEPHDSVAARAGKELLMRMERLT